MPNMYSASISGVLPWIHLIKTSLSKIRIWKYSLVLKGRSFISSTVVEPL